MAKRNVGLLGKTAQKARARSRVKKELSPELSPETLEEIRVLKEAAKVLKKELPPGWPKDVVPNVRAFGPLPTGWHHGKKLTKASGRGSGGKLLGCYVGPQGKVFYHKTDLEKFLGYKVDAAIGPEGRRVICPQVSHEFALDGVLRRTDKSNKSEYINTRCDSVAGYSVQEALLTFSYKCNDNVHSYGVSDLRYDLKTGLLVIETEESKKQEAAKHRSDAAPPIAEKMLTLSSMRTAGAASKLRQAAPCGKVTAEDASASSCLKRRKSAGTLEDLFEQELAEQQSKTRKQQAGTKRARVTPSKPSTTSSSSSDPVGPWWSGAALRNIVKDVYGPLKHRAARGQGDETAIFTMLGAGHQLGMDASMLSVLPAILRKEPSARGEFGEMTLKQYETALSQHM